MRILLQDFKYALRQLRRNLGFAVTAVLTLALGIGAATAVFSVAYGVLIDPFPYKDVSTLATVKMCRPDWSRCGWSVYTAAEFRELARHTKDIFSGITASTISDVALTGRGEPQRLRGNYITANTFSVLGVQPLLGRASTEADVQPNAGPVALLSYRYWQAHFGGNRSILGRVLTFNGQPRTIIGVMPPRFLWRGADVYLPIQITPGETAAGLQHFALVGRLKPGVTDAQAASELKPVFDDFRKTDPRAYPKDLRVGLLPFSQMFQSGLAGTLYLLLGSVFVLLLIACINVSSLLLARAVNREHEFVVRAAVGASRMRLVRFAFSESLLLAAAATPVALLFAYLGLMATLRIIPKGTIPDEAVITLNLPVLLVSLGIALFTVFLFGLAPAWHAANPRLAAALGSGTRSSGGRTQRHLLNGFVVTEIALSLALLMLAALMVRSLIAVESVPLPFPPDNTLLLRIPLEHQRYPTAESQARFFREFMDQASAVPGVKAVSVDLAMPFFGAFGLHPQIAGRPIDKHFVALHATTPSYLALSASGMRVLQGHFLDEREISEHSHDMVVSEDFAKKYFSGQNVLGSVVHFPEMKTGSLKLKDDAFTVVGVVSAVPSDPNFGEDLPDVFIPYTVYPYIDAVLVSTRIPAAGLENAMRRVVYGIDRDQPIAEMMTFHQALDIYGYADPRFALALFGAFAAAALALCMIGIYGVLSFVTSQRTQEIGIRIALGAPRARVMWLVFRQACLLSLFGVLAGLPLALFAGHFASDDLVRTSQHDPLALAAVVCILPLFAVAATYLPARRAASIDPVRALRAE